MTQKRESIFGVYALSSQTTSAFLWYLLVVKKQPVLIARKWKFTIKIYLLWHTGITWWRFHCDLNVSLQNNNLNASFHNYSNEMNIKKVALLFSFRRSICLFVGWLLWTLLSVDYEWFVGNLGKLQFKAGFFPFFYEFQECWTLVWSSTSMSFGRKIKLSHKSLHCLLFWMWFFVVVCLLPKFIFNSPSFPFCLVRTFFLGIWYGMILVAWTPNKKKLSHSTSK